MKLFIPLLSALAAGAAHAHDSFVPHQHPHETSMLPDVGTFGVAALLLAVAVIVYARFKRG
jgi:hypothetical protein